MAERVNIETGISGEGQEGSFANATLQAVGNLDESVLDMSIAVYVEVPEEYAREEAKAVEYLQRLFGSISAEHPEVSVEIQVGPAGDGEEINGYRAGLRVRFDHSTADTWREGVIVATEETWDEERDRDAVVLSVRDDDGAMHQVWDHDVYKEA